jgi:sporulation protein YlmC with PRC-barrel domain
MKRGLLAGAALLIAVTTASAQEFYVVQDSSTRRCTVVEQKPSGTMSVVSGTKVYTSRADAEAALNAATICTAAAKSTDKPSTIGTATQSGQARAMTQAPANAVSITKLYKQAVYDNGNNRIGEIDDVLMTNDGRVAALVVGVGGFLGIGEKHVIVPFNAVTPTDRDGSIRLVMNTTKEDLNASTGFRYEKSKYVWVTADRSQTPPPRK